MECKILRSFSSCNHEGLPFGIILCGGLYLLFYSQAQFFGDLKDDKKEIGVEDATIIGKS